MRASHAHIGISQTVLVSGFSGNHQGLNGPYDVDLSNPETLNYRRRLSNAPLSATNVPLWVQLRSWVKLGSHTKPKMAWLAFDSHVKGGGRWTLRDEDGGVVVGHVQPGEWPTPEGEYCDAATGRTRVTVTPERATPSLWAAHVFPAPDLSRDEYAISARHVPQPLLDHPGLAMLTTCKATWRSSSWSGSSGSTDCMGNRRCSQSSSEPLLSSKYSANTLRQHSHKMVSRVASVFTRCLKPDARFTLLYSHSAEDDLGELVADLEQLANTLNCHLLLYDYEGYSTSRLEGTAPSEAGCFRAAEAAWWHLVSDEANGGRGIKPEDIVLFGRGLGAGPTLHLADLASRRSQPCAGVLLQSPCISPVTLLVGFTAVAWCGCPSRVDAWGTRIQGILEFGSVDCLVCVVHGADDEKVPVEHGLLAHRLAKKPYLKGLWLDMCGHENLPASLVEPYLQGFISKLTTGEAEERAAADARAARPTDEELGLGYFKELRENFGPGGLHNNGGSDSNGINGIGDGESGEGGILEEDVRNLVGGYELANNGYSGCVLC